MSCQITQTGEKFRFPEHASRNQINFTTILKYFPEKQAVMTAPYGNTPCPASTSSRTFIPAQRISARQDKNYNIATLVARLLEFTSLLH
jgi:hypothetical protein